MLWAAIANGQIDFTAIHYRGIRPDDRSGLMPIRNPGRGFRIEDTLDFSMAFPHYKIKLDSTSHLKMNALKYGSDSVTLVQTTLLLPATEPKLITDSTLKVMQIYLDTLRAMGLKCVFHLAYKVIPGNTKGQKQVDLLHRPEQLQPLIDRNKDIILEVQDGLMGSWNPGRSSTLIDGFKVALQLRLMQMNNLSISGIGKEGGSTQKNPLENWRNQPLDPDQLTSEKMPFSEDYFKSSSGNIVQRPVFDYIRDHLGYRIELQQLMLPAKRPDNSPIHLKLELINRGFAAVKQPCTVAFVLIDQTGKVFELPATGDPATWQPFAAGDVSFKPVTYNIEYLGKLPLHLIPGKYKLGIWIADATTLLHYNYRYDIRCANGNTGWWISRDGKYGINILTSLTISK